MFPIYAQPIDRLKQILLRGRRTFFTPFHALNGVSLTVGRGETIGIVGRNGSGKSTLLQIIAGLLAPTAGTVSVNGRVSALLELGAGFNPAFSGRDNVYLNAAILGLARDEVDERFDRIVAFSGIADYIDRPVETYSSGMYVRLAFAVAVSVDPDILIVDEALAVGDEGFQRKCFSRIEEMRENGTTILFVSHAAAMITQLCDRAVLIDRGEVLADGQPKSVIFQYHRLIHAPGERQEAIRADIIEGKAALGAEKTEQHETNVTGLVSQSRTEYESRGARIENPRVVGLDGKPMNQLLRGRRYRFTYDVAFEQPAHSVRFAMLIKTKTGIELGGKASERMRARMPDFPAGSRVTVSFDFACQLASGTYFLNCGVNGLLDGERTPLHRILDAVMFQVLADEDDTVTGMVDFDIIPSLDTARPDDGAAPAVPAAGARTIHD